MGDWAKWDEVFVESDSEEYASMVARTADLLAYVSLFLRRDSGAEQRLQELMPRPLKTPQQLHKLLQRREPLLSLEDLVDKFSDLEALEKQVSELGNYPILHGFLSQRHLIARHFLMAPVLAVLAAEDSRSWKEHYGYRARQAWVFLEHSEQRVRDLIAKFLPRSSAAARSTAEVARLMDEVSKRAECYDGLEAWSALRSFESCGIFNEEWVSDDDPLALVAFELIVAELPFERTEEDDITPLHSCESDGTQGCLELFRPLGELHTLRFATVKVIGIKLLEHYIHAGFDQPVQPLQAYQGRNQLILILDSLRHSAFQMGLSVDAVFQASPCVHVEDLLEAAKLLLQLKLACSCCAPGMEAIVECAGVYSLPLAKLRLPQLAREVLRNWKKPEFDKLWMDIPEPPFPAPILDEIETYVPKDPATGLGPTQSLEPPSLEYLVGQFRKAEAHGLVNKQHQDFQGLVLRTSLQVLEMAEAKVEGAGPPEIVHQVQLCQSQSFQSPESGAEVVKKQDSASRGDEIQSRKRRSKLRRSPFVSSLKKMVKAPLSLLVESAKS